MIEDIANVSLPVKQIIGRNLLAIFVSGLTIFGCSSVKNLTSEQQQTARVYAEIWCESDNKQAELLADLNKIIIELDGESSAAKIAKETLRLAKEQDCID